MIENAAAVNNETNPNGSADMVDDLFGLQTDLRVLLYMPNDLCALYKDPLINRFKETGIHLTITPPEKPPENAASFDNILAYNCDLPVAHDPLKKGDDSSKDAELFHVKGSPSKALTNPFPRSSNYFTPLEVRYLDLKKTIKNQEEDERFLSLALIQQQIHFKLLEVSKIQVKVDEFKDHIKEIDEGYYHILAYYLKEAISNVMQLVTLGDVMKRYVKVLIIDDQGERIYERLEERGFRRRYVAIMGQHAFNHAYHQFREMYEEQFPGEKASYSDFYIKCSIFDEHEIVCYNPWRQEDGKIPVQFILRKPPELSRKEMRIIKEDPAKKAIKIDRAERNREKLESQLNITDQELRAAENKGHLSEADYVALNKKRKRIIAQIKKVKEELKKLQKTVSDKPELTVYSRDFLAALNDRKIVKSIKTLDAQTEELNLDPANLSVMAGLTKQKQQKDGQIRKLNAQIKSLAEKMQKDVEERPLDEGKSFQQMLGVHTLNRLEMSVLSCAIAKINRFVNVYKGPYFENSVNQTTVKWNDQLISGVSVFVASKNIKVDVSLLQRFFRIEGSQAFERIENSPVLPKSADFDNQKFGLFILNNDAYPFDDIADCIKMRNQSQRPFVPVLLLDPRDEIQINKGRIILDLLIGLKKDANKTFSLSAPTYRIASIDDPERLCSILCEVMGIDQDSVPSFAENDEIDFDIEAEEPRKAIAKSDIADAELELDGTPSFTKKQESQSRAATGKEPEEPQTAVRSLPTVHKDTITIFVEEEKPEEIYTLGSLFSFEDERKSTEAAADNPEAIPANESEADAHVAEEELEALKEKTAKEKANFESTNLF